MSTPLPLRIALDATPLLGARTGVAAFTANLVDRLAGRAGVDPAVYAVTWRGRAALAAAVPAGVRVIDRRLPARPLREAWARVGLPPAEWLLGRVDVVHGTNFVVPPTRRAAAVVTVHDLTSVHFPELCTPDVRRYPALLRAAIDRGAWVHTVSAHVAGEVVDLLGAPEDRVVTVHQGVPGVAAADPESGRRLAGADAYLLALGTVEPRKQLPMLVEAFDRVAAARPAVRLVVAGPEGWAEDELRRAVGAARHRERITRLGWVDDADRAALLRGAVALAYPSRYEGFGLPPLEAMSAGVPVVATAAGSLPEVLGDAALLVPLGDVDALAGALETVLDDESVRDRLASAGYARAARYSWDECADGIVDLYRRASGGV